MRMTEAMLQAPRDVALRNSELGALDGQDVLVDVVACGVCTSELPVYRGETVGVPGVSFRYAQYPANLGHEVSGIVSAVGSDVRTLSVGDRVTGVAYSGSGFATHVVEPESAWVPVPASIPLEQALGEPLMAVANIVHMAEPEVEDSIFIVGDGFMSLLTTALLARSTLSALVVAGHHDNRLAIARDSGATHVINTHREDPYWFVRRLVDGEGFDPEEKRWLGGVDIAMDFAGKMATLQLCASLCKPKQRAKLMMPSFYGPEPFTIGHYLMNRAPTLVVCHPAHSRDVMDDLRRAMHALTEGVFPMDRLITHAYSLESVTRAMEDSVARADGYIKGIVVPDPSLLESPDTYRMVGF